jgi:uncharacterized protein YneF (UPF0154 family)
VKKTTSSSTPIALNWWLMYALTFVYVGVEFAFNYQLLNISVDFVSDDVLLGLEFWGRILSGLGLSLVIYRNSNRLNIPNALRGALCLVIGIALMWNVQKWITDYLVDQASIEDKEVSLILATLTKKASEGKLKTEAGNTFLTAQVNEQDRKIAASLFPAIALYTPNRLKQVSIWSEMNPAQIKGLLARNDSEASLPNAYRNLIIPPLTLGISIFYALLNLAQWLGMSLSIFQERLGISSLQIRLLTSCVFLSFLLYSFMSSSAFANSKAFREELSPALFENDPSLAVLTNISAYAVPNWYFLSSWCHKYVLGGIQLKRPY